ncbi:hypothetical protein [Pontibacillus yanchengensis]|uniref:Glycerophosphoryl diester phosphodiesterase membrane domain-containing protein n=1 Tax=Pontibacillus yanchengensis Y32 TaxID=1385514 RepID=A0A0A2TEZ4_9BACI|nr:hypothetical protein [Pontibacillus yanchengensis]KGP74144.1 hypothetical protein N782_17605 [Pontibacillus yanchengensis Y32]
MNVKQTKPKSFSEILDDTFRLVKENFSSLFFLVLVSLGPLYLIQALFMLLSGKSFFRETGEGGFLSNLNQTENGADFQGTLPINTDSIALLITYIVIISITGIVLYIISQSSIVLATKKIHEGEAWSIKQVIKQAFSRFWPLLGSSLLFILMIVGAFAFTVLTYVGVARTYLTSIGGTIALFIIATLALAALFIFLFTKVSMFFVAVTFEHVAPGMKKSWNLIKGRFWPTFGMYVVCYIIISMVGSVVNLIMTAILGGSVLGSMVSYLVTLITTIIFFVAYTLLYIDLKTRNEAGDLKDMISSYKQDENPETPSL